MTATATRTADQWVICQDYAAGPFVPDAVDQVIAKYDRSGCPHKGHHRVIVSAQKPVTLAKLQTMYANWSQPFLADPSDKHADAERAADTADLAAAILEVGAREPQIVHLYGFDGPMVLNGGGWSKETADAADAAAPVGIAEWKAALGPYEHVTLTADGQGAIRDTWCECGTGAEDWVRYEGWTVQGMVAHGFVCGTCRKITQTG